MRVSVCMPIYRASSLLDQSLGSLFRQDVQDFEVLIGDNTPDEMPEELERTREIISRFDSSRIQYHRNKKNLGYPENLKKIVSRATGDILFLMAHDDLLSRDAIRKTRDAFLLDKDIGVVARPYFWFLSNPAEPVRAVLPLDPLHDRVVSVRDSSQVFDKLFESVGQLSGLAYRRSALRTPFHTDIFPCHIYPFADILTRHRCVFLKDYTVAARIEASQTRTTSSTYDQSPTESWLKLFEEVFAAPENHQLRDWGIDLICRHFEGLVQLKAFGRKGTLERELKLLLSRRPRNLADPKFWAYALMTGLLPPRQVAQAADLYKKLVGARTHKDIAFNC